MTMNSQSETRSWRVILTSDTAHMASLRDVVTNAAGKVGFDDLTVSQIVLAVDEAVGNVIKHGYEGRSGNPIEVTMNSVRLAEGPALEIEICDCGRQVDPSTIVGRDLEDIRPGGLGTHIIRNAMDKVEYSVREPQGMKLRMVKVLRDGTR